MTSAARIVSDASALVAVEAERNRIRTAIDRRCRAKGHTGWGTCQACRDLAGALLDAPRVELAVASEGP